MAEQQYIDLTPAPEFNINIVQKDKLNHYNATINVFDSEDQPFDMTQYDKVELVVYRNDESGGELFKFSTETDPAGIVLGPSFFILVTDGMPMTPGTYRFGLRELDNPQTLGKGYFIVSRRY